MTTPLLEIVAIEGSALSHVPPDEGDMVVVLAIQIVVGPVKFAAGQNNKGVGSLLFVGSPSLSGSGLLPF